MAYQSLIYRIGSRLDFYVVLQAVCRFCSPIFVGKGNLMALKGSQKCDANAVTKHI